MNRNPRYAPHVYVNHTFVIKCQHPFVNPNGLVVVYYLQNWVNGCECGLAVIW